MRRRRCVGTRYLPGASMNNLAIRADTLSATLGPVGGLTSLRPHGQPAGIADDVLRLDAAPQVSPGLAKIRRRCRQVIDRCVTNSGKLGRFLCHRTRPPNGGLSFAQEKAAGRAAEPASCLSPRLAVEGALDQARSASSCPGRMRSGNRRTLRSTGRRSTPESDPPFGNSLL